MLSLMLYGNKQLFVQEDLNYVKYIGKNVEVYIC